MKRQLTYILIFTFIIFGLSGCETISGKNASLSIIYAATAILSLLMFVSYLFFVRKKNIWFVLLFTCVFIVNIGYYLLSVSPVLETALFSNRIAYLGSVFLPMSMFMIILNVTNTKYNERLTVLLTLIAVLIFLIAASPGYLDIYYEDVDILVINGVTTLQKVYGPLHPLYMLYLFGYFSVMVATIISAHIKKRIDTTAHAVILAIAVFVNIGVWFIEQLVAIDFEFLAVSYIISEMFLLGLDYVMNENQKLKEIVKDVKTVQNFTLSDTSKADSMMKHTDSSVNIDRARFEIFIEGIEQLTQTERLIYDAHIARITTKEIMASLNIKENILKFHNKNLYSKLGVSSRKELLEIYKALEVAKNNYAKKIDATTDKS